MNSVTSSFDYGIEPAVFVDGVLDSSDSTIGFVKGVLALGQISITSFFLGMDVTGVVVLNSIGKFVFCWSLK